MPFCHLELRAPKPESPGPEPQNFAGAIRWRRKRLGLTQRELAHHLGVSAETIRNWELGQTRPGLRQTPQAADFLGRLMLFRPGKPLDFPVRLLLARRRLGLSQDELAARIGVSEYTVWEWENGNHAPTTEHRAAAESVIEETLGTRDFVAEKIRALRKSLGLTQREFTGRLGVNPNTVSKWERGKQRPREGMVENIGTVRS